MFWLFSILPFVIYAVGLYIAYRVVRGIDGIGAAIRDRTTTTTTTTAPAPAAAPQESTDALRLQACERFTLMLERISVPNLLLRMPTGGDETAREYTARLLLGIREEVEYNVTQQIYVSDALWQIITQARDNVSQLIVRAAEGAETGPQLAGRLRLMSAQQPTDPVALAQGAIRREAATVLTK